MAMRDPLDDLITNVLHELHCPLSSARRAHPSSFAGEGDKKGVLESIAIHSIGTVWLRSRPKP